MQLKERMHRKEGRRVQGDFITLGLDLPGLRIAGCERRGAELVISVRYRCMERRCPYCSRETSHVHQYHRQLKEHLPLWGMRVVLELSKRRFWCRRCQRAFMEPDEVCGRRRRSTREFRAMVADRCRDTTVRAVSMRAGVSEGLVRRSFAELVPTLIEPPQVAAQVVSLDELWMGPKKGYLTLLYGLEERRVLAVEPGRSQISAETALISQANGDLVRVVVIDMSETYRQAVRYACPGAVIVADKFHVLARVLSELGHVITRVQTQATREDARVLRRRRLFSAPPAMLSLTERTERDRLLSSYPALREAWNVVQEFRVIYQLQDREQARQRLDSWWSKVRRQGPREFRGLYFMLSHWREEILNYFSYRVTNGFAEGKNNRIKAIIRAAYGYRNLDNLTQRIMLAYPAAAGARGVCSPHYLT